MKVISNISYSQSEILNNIMNMHNSGKPFECDMTYSLGKFYGKFGDIEIPQPKYRFDVSPQVEGVEKIEPWGRLPLEDGSVESIVIDLPFVVSPPNAPSMKKDDGKRRNVIARRFASYYPVDEMFRSYEHWIGEAYRVLKDGGKCIFKTQNTISGRRFYCTSEFSWLMAQKKGFYVLDKFILLAKSRIISGKITVQRHARNFTSVFYVFEKNGTFPTIDYDRMLKKLSE